MQNPIDRRAQMVRVKPAPGRAVRIPERGFSLLPDAGMEVPCNAFWARRIAAGDVEVMLEPSTKTVKDRKEASEK